MKNVATKLNSLLYADFISADPIKVKSCVCCLF